MAEVKTSKAEILTQLLTAYGIGVRAGAITPCLEDEQEFRKLLGLPVAPTSVIQDWADSAGVRRPITLQRPSQTEESGASSQPAQTNAGVTSQATEKVDPIEE